MATQPSPPHWWPHTSVFQAIYGLCGHLHFLHLFWGEGNRTVYTCGGQRTPCRSGLSPHHVHLRDRIQAIILHGRHLYPLSPHAFLRSRSWFPTCGSFVPRQIQVCLLSTPREFGGEPGVLQMFSLEPRLWETSLLVCEMGLNLNSPDLDTAREGPGTLPE